MDTIEQEDWSDIASEYKVWADGHDKEGRPSKSLNLNALILFFHLNLSEFKFWLRSVLVLYANLGSWDLRRAVLSGKLERILRYVSMIYERTTNRIREMAARNQTVSQGIVILDIADFNLRQHGCFQCKEDGRNNLF
jgi:hypothetical protein